MEIEVKGCEDVERTITALSAAIQSQISHDTHNTEIRTLRIVDCRVYDEGMDVLVDFLATLPLLSTLETLEIVHCFITDVKALKRVKWVRHLHLVDDSYDEESIADLLDDNETLELLDVYIGGDMIELNTEPISQALAYNSTLRTLIIPTTTLNHLGYALTINTTLESLVITNQMWALVKPTYFADSLQSNWSLTYLDIGLFDQHATDEEREMMRQKIDDTISNQRNTILSLFDLLFDYIEGLQQ